MAIHLTRESKTETPDPDPGPRPHPDQSPPGTQATVEIHETTYLKDHVAAFMRSQDLYGDLSNMTFGYPLKVNEITFQGPEGLYQALKFPDLPGFQKLIGAQKSGMEAKKTAYQKSCVRPDWEDVKVEAMNFTLGLKLLQHPRKFREALAQTGTWPIVEMSMRDAFWGAKPKRANTVLVGMNVLGKLLVRLREELQNSGGDPAKSAQAFIDRAETGSLLVNGRPVTQSLIT